MMGFKYVCNDCGYEFRSDGIVYVCPECGKKNDGKTFPRGYLSVIYDEADLRSLAAKPDLSFYDFFPYVVPFKDAYPVGNTALARPVRLAGKYGLENLSMKLDGQLVSGSFKDRASQLIAAQALHFGERKIALASTGNAGAAMCCAGAAYGLDIVLFVPETAPVNKLMQSVLYNATVVPVRGTYDDAFLLSLAYTDNFGGINRNTAYNPMTIEGKKSVSIELFLQLGRKAPDAVYVPVGDGCIISGVYKGFYDLLHAGLIDKLPHIICCQSSGSDAISRAYASGSFSNIEEATTLADSISVESPAAGRMAVRALKESAGWTVVVDDSEILRAQRELCAEAGLFVEPAAACAFAALVSDADNLKAKLGEDAEVCVLLTGTGFKDMKVFDSTVKMPDAIDNSVEAVLKRFGRL